MTFNLSSVISRMRSKPWAWKLAVLALFVVSAGAMAALFAPPALAQVVDPTDGLETFAETAGFSTTGDIRITIARLIRTGISFLGILAVVFILYGGFLYMTAGGADDKVKRAKKVFTSALVGLVIILSSFAIAQFVLSRLTESLGGTTTGDDGTNGTYADGGGGTASQFLLSSVNTECAEAMVNFQLQFAFSKNVSLESVDAGGIEVASSDGTAVAGTFDVSGRRVTFTPSQECAEDVTEFCFDAETSYVVTLDSAVLESSTGTSLTCSLDNPCSYAFTTGTGMDVSGPTLTMDAPDDGSTVYANDIQLLQTLAADDTGVSSVDFYVDGDLVYQAALATDSTEAALAASNYFFTGDGTEWDTAGYTDGSYDVYAEGLDCAGNADTSDRVTVALRPAYCDNGVQDEDETDVDCGGDSCGACDGGSCASDADCSGGYCDESSGTCVSVPKIEEVSPGDGAAGNLVTISGEGFGATASDVTFLGDDTTNGDDVTVSAYECSGAVQWSDDEIVIQIPDGAADGPVEVSTADGYSDRTDDDYGPTISDFDVNGVERPGICALDPSTDVGNSSVTVDGLNFGASQGSSTVYFTNYEASSYDDWSNTALSVVVPLLDARAYRAQVWAGDYVCVNADGSLPGTSCSEDGDCAVDDVLSASCSTMRCSGSDDACESDSDCSEDESCVSRRQGSNKVTFTVTDASAGDIPTIVSVESGWEACSDGTHCGEDADCSSGTCDAADNWGPPGQYVTVRGTGFGSSTGTVRFTDNAGYALGDVEFPEACGEDFWSDDEITVKVPSAYSNIMPDDLAFGTFSLTVETARGAESEGTEFVIRDDEPGPGICHIDPSAGPAGTSVTVSGDNLGSQGSGFVEFYDGQSIASVDFWNDAEIQLDVASEASTGPVFVSSNEGFTSNAVNFEVGDCSEDASICGEGEQCCANGSCSASCEEEVVDAHYAWTFSTGVIPATPRVAVFCGDRDDDGTYDGVSPGPWESWSVPSDVCVNAGVTATFTEVMDQNSFEGNVRVQACDGLDAEDPCANLNDGDDTNDGDVDGSVVATSEYVFSWDPTSGAFEPSTTYRVTLDSTGIKADDSAGGAYMASDYSWDFTTSSSTDLCDVGNVYVSPSNFTATEEGEPVDYAASPISDEDDCVPLQCTAYAWNWDSSDTSKAVLIGNDAGLSDACENTAEAIAETSGVLIEAGPDGVTNDPTDTGELVVNFTDPEVTGWTPSCDTACINGGILVDFNATMSDGFVAGDTVVLYACEDSLCDDDELTAWSTGDYGTSYSAASNRLAVSHDDFAPNTWYRVVISGDVTSESGVELSVSGSNYPSDANNVFPGDFSWTFKTKDSDAPCSVDRVEVNPKAASATVIGQQHLWEAAPYGAPDSCSLSGQALDATDYDWDAWTATDDPNVTGTSSDVATMLDSGLLSLTSDLEDGCTAECLHGGADVTVDDPVCGDGITDYDGNGVNEAEDCDLGDVESGDGCSAECLYEGNAVACDSTTTAGCCGNLLVEADEECDDGDLDDNDGCTTICLNNGSATCGDGRVDYSLTLGGEDCDDGNTRNDDGCSSECLFEGGQDVGGVDATCGNDSVENGEDCDDGNASDGDGCSSACLFEGASACAYECAGGANDGDNCSGLGDVSCGTGSCLPPVTPCCGDLETDYDDDGFDDAEDCEDGNTEDGDGCSSECLSEGSSVDYASASYCGDGDVGTGEECDAASSASYDIGYRGVSTISPDASIDVIGGRAGASVTATESSTNESGAGELALSCSCGSDDSCGDESALGCGLSNCCYPRPEETQRYPLSGAGDVCRNTAVWVDFTDDMDPNTFTAWNDADGDGVLDAGEGEPNLYLELTSLDGSAVSQTNCPYIDAEFSFLNRPGSSWFARAWIFVARTVRGFFGESASAATYACVVPVSYAVTQNEEGGSRVALSLTGALEENGTYRFVVVKDAAPSDAVDAGVLSVNAVGVAFSGDGEDDTAFTTGTEICELDEVVVEDLGVTESLLSDLIDPSPEYFTETGEEHQFQATSYTARSGRLEEIAEMPGYAWSWAWQTSEECAAVSATCAEEDLDDNIVAATGGDLTATAVTAIGNTGRETVVSTATFASDNTFGDALGGVSGTLVVTANVCDNPPTVGFPYTDSSSNFSFFYCRDAGSETEIDDLPEIGGPVDVISFNPDVIIQELIFTVEGTADAIGVRVLKNEEYLSPSAWYEAQGFSGSPSETTVDGYAAVADGNTVYVAAANAADSGAIYPNVYVISYTEDADEESQTIFEQILDNWSFNANTDRVTDVNVCVSGAGDYASDAEGVLVSCDWDGDCLELGAGFTCDAEKAKLTRDMLRLTDVTTIAAGVEAYGEENGLCSVTTNQECTDDSDCPGSETCEPSVPTLENGTFVRSLAVSAWPSWSSELGNALGTAVPEDPLNAFFDCTDSGYEEATCWNPLDSTFSCPDESHVYGYQSVGGTSYKLYAQLEYDQAVWAYDLDPSGAFETFAVEYDFGGSTTPPTGFETTELFCNGAELGNTSICGDGIVSADEACEIGQTSSDQCTDDDYTCADSSLLFPAYARTCTGLDDTTSCTGSYYDTCVESSGGSFLCAAVETASAVAYADCSDFDSSSCAASSSTIASRLACVRVERAATGTVTTTCESDCSGFQTAAEAQVEGAECTSYACGNGVVESDEDCDDGFQNGTYGHCGDDCSLDTAFYCGDGFLAGAEQCDCGTVANFTDVMADADSWADRNGCLVSNGQWDLNSAGTCSWECQAPGPSCGDGEVNGDESCDGDYETWDGALCVGGDDDGSACSTDSDCDSDACGSSTDADYAACGTSAVCVGGSDAGEACDASGLKADGTACAESCSSFDYELTRTRTCMASGADMCQWASTSAPGGWTACEGGPQTCGNGLVEGSETCDDGNTENTDACTDACVLNVCGDDYVYAGVESCDAGSENGTACDAAYGGTCNFCTSSCQYRTESGSYCGDGELNGTEFCDGSQTPYYYVDYATGEGVRDQGDCDAEGDTTTTEDGDTYTCRWVGVCNGGENQGNPCTLDPDTAAAYADSDSADQAGCGTDGECVAPTCADDCSSMCPFSYETVSVLAQTEEAGANAESSIDLYRYLSGNAPDNAVFYLPACEVGTQMTADVDTDNIVPPSTDIVFVTDLSGSMNDSPSGDTASAPSRRIDYVSESAAEAVGELFDFADANGSVMRIGLVSFTSSYRASATEEFCNHWDATRDGAHMNEDFLTSASESRLTSMIESYATECVGDAWNGATTTYAGLEVAMDMLAGSTADVKAIILLADGAPSHNGDYRIDGSADEGDAAPYDECSDTAYSYRSLSLSSTSACVAEAADLVDDDPDVQVYTAVISDNPNDADYIAHVSSETCDWSTASLSADTCATGSYAFSATDANGIADMYDSVVDGILNVTLGLSTEASDGSVDLTTGTVGEGRDQLLPFPEEFACTGADMTVPFTVDFNGEGYVNLSDITFTYCPAP